MIREQRPRGRWSSLAAFLSFLWPGLGQAHRGRRRAAAIHGLPVLALAAGAVLFVLVAGPAVTFVYLLQPTVALLVGLLVVALALWRAWSIADAARPAPPQAVRRHASAAPRPAWSTRILVLTLILVVGLMHGWAGAVTWTAYEAGQKIAQPVDPTPPPDQPNGSPLSPGATLPPTPSPPPSPLPQGRITVLLLGRDRAADLTDTMQIASFEPGSGEVTMIAVPRDTGQLPLYNGGTWPRKINELLSYAENRPAQFPDGGMRTLMNQLGYIIGVPIHYYAHVDFAGFVGLVDAVGGVDVVLDRPIADATYNVSPTERGFYMEPGPHHLDGATALMYVRSRHGPGNSDFQRARRQQQVIIALRDKIDDPQVLANLPALIVAVSEMVRTDVPLDRLPDLVSLLQRSAAADTKMHTLRPPTYAQVIPQSEIGRVYMTRLKMDAVAQLSIELFGEESRYWAGGASD